MTRQERFQKETGKQSIVVPVCHGERVFYTDEYVQWLEDENESLTNELSELKKSIYEK
jgi:hypothetical protein